MVGNGSLNCSNCRADLPSSRRIDRRNAIVVGGFGDAGCPMW
jgi:hypothetical protein